jgi:Transposase IS4
MDSAPQKTRSSTRQRNPTWKKRELDDFVPVAIEQLPVDPTPFLDDPLPVFEPDFRVKFESMRSNLPVDDPLSLFIALFGEESLDIIVDCTNAKAESFTPDIPSPSPRPWTSLSRNELITFLGTLFYMGRHFEHNREYYWTPGFHQKLQGAISKTRWEQIYRFLSIHQVDDHNDINNYKPWFNKLDPLITIIRNRIASAVTPSTWIAVDEMMVAFQGRSSHTIKIKNKPIKEGFKLWVLGFQGYIYTFRFHSGVDGSENMTRRQRVEQISPLKPVWLAPTFQVPVVLCSDVHQIQPKRQFLVFLDNLFLTVDVAHCLLNINFATMGTTRKNAAGVPNDLLAIKNADKEEDKKLFKWNSAIARIVGRCLVFLWQDNNLVIGITTAHSLHRVEDQVERLRRRPKASSRMANITWPAFNGEIRKWLHIPGSIDDYNHGMNGVDLASQFRGGFTCHRPHSFKWWKPLLFWLLDICCNNAYLIWRLSQSWTRHVMHQTFMDRLIDDMLRYNQWTPTPGKAELHQVRRLDKPRRCAYGLSGGGCVQGQRRHRQFGTELSGNARDRIRPAQVRTACNHCNVALCTRGRCWQLYHQEVNR